VRPTKHCPQSEGAGGSPNPDTMNVEKRAEDLRGVPGPHKGHDDWWRSVA
jgi:hypothetical protein